MFAAAAINDEVQPRGLYKTAELTQHAMAISKEILKAVVSDESYKEMILASQKSNDDMDDLITLVVNIDARADFLNGVEVAEIEKMLKSQQSKRSRLKNKTMTLENYTQLMTAGVAELLLRTAGNLPKGRGSDSRRLTIGYTNDELNKLIADQEALAKAIRNVQSKKCIAKGKANFDPQSDEYQAMLMTEEQLKSLRVGGNQNAVVANKAKKVDEVNEILKVAEDIQNMSAKDAKALLMKIAQQVAAE